VTGEDKPTPSWCEGCPARKDLDRMIPQVATILADQVELLRMYRDMESRLARLERKLKQEK